MEKNLELNTQAIPFVIGTFSVVFMLALSAIGATVGSVKSASSAAVVSNRGVDLITKSYLPVLFASAGFMYSIIVTFLSLPKLQENMTIDTAWKVMSACFIYGIGSLFSGLAIGEANKHAIVRLSENRKVFLSMIIINSTIELPAVFSLICSVIILS
ncbi:V-type H+-transporting ATPase 16kDa proteolipid subunit [Nematocida minor]|uniref:V-type H+-transporting ATPase 16kDa proteolipid subunit n=1 Tax=Nematocida minor TaxID=1912983 RepID=UPI0022203048|nr:V-type H+-transporting ATPase 16kDa proteolipid subunit [Nematocida minor]KAI5191206.1 V-type H+-transporting ATPase 16kDa proteolipid subunit [Nematocida minor]